MTTNNSPARTVGRRQPALSHSPDKSLDTRKAAFTGKELLDLVCPAEKVGPIPDPAHLAASVMLATGMRAAGISLAQLAKPGLVVRVQAPSSEWVKPLRHAWVKDVAGKEGAADGVRDRGYHPPHIGTLTFSENEAPSNHDRKQGEEAFARAVALQSRIVGFSSDLAWLPADLIAATDRLVELSPLSPGDISNLAKRVTGSKPKVTIAAEDAEAVTPRLARLAVRPDQEADDFIHRLAGLARADRAAAKQVGTAGPRKAVMGIRATPTLDRIHGMDAAVTWGLQLRDDLQAFRMGERSWSDVDRGLLLSGPPGTGKTLFARALAATCGVPLISGSYGTWLAHGTGHQGDLLIAMRKSFQEARSGSPSILFVDEVDAFADRARVTHHPEWHLEIVNTLLTELDGVEDREGVVVVAACNYPEMLDPALVRGGRLDRHIRVGLPDADALASILCEHLEGALQGVDLSGIGLLLLGSTGADVERMVRGARRRARLACRGMEMTDLLAEAGGDDVRDAGDMLLCAVHEAGHAVAAITLGLELQGVTLRGGVGNGGRTRVSGGSGFVTAADVYDMTVALLCGRAAEEVVLRRVTSGAGGASGCDLQKATLLAARSASELGLEEDHGLSWTPLPDRQSELSAMLAGDPRLASLVRARLASAYGSALNLMERHQSAVQGVADRLVEKGALDVAEVRRILGHSGVPS